MCLGVVGQVKEVDGMEAQVDFFGVRKKVRLDVVDEPVVPGDYILNHVGFAIRRIPPEELDATLAFYQELIDSNDQGDLMAMDVKSDMRSEAEETR